MIALIAEDNPGVRALAQRMLSPLCSTILLAERYQEVHDIIQRQEKLHIAALDVALVDGELEECKQTIRYIRAKFPDAVIMVWSGYVQERGPEFLKEGADGFLAKGAGLTMEGFYELLLTAIQKRWPSEDKEHNISANLKIISTLVEAKKAHAIES